MRQTAPEAAVVPGRIMLLTSGDVAGPPAHSSYGSEHVPDHGLRRFAVDGFRQFARGSGLCPPPSSTAGVGRSPAQRW